MGTHLIPREIDGDARILLIFTPKGFIGTLIGIGIGAFFYSFAAAFGAALVGWVLLAICAIIGFIVAIILYSTNFIRRVFEPYLVILNSLPKIALGPLIIIWVGVGTNAIVTMGILICVVITTINLLNAFLEVPQEKIMLLKSMGANRIQILWHLILPATLPAFMSTLKINLGMAWVGVIMGEYLSSKAGLGYLLVYGGQVFKLDLVMSAIIILCILSGLMYGLLSILEKLILKKR